jgi:hypothetical protein
MKGLSSNTGCKFAGQEPNTGCDPFAGRRRASIAARGKLPMRAGCHLVSLPRCERTSFQPSSLFQFVKESLLQLPSIALEPPWIFP